MYIFAYKSQVLFSQGGIFTLLQPNQVNTFYSIMTGFLLHVRGRTLSTWANATCAFAICTRRRVSTAIKIKFGIFIDAYNLACLAGRISRNLTVLRLIKSVNDQGNTGRVSN